MGCPCARPSINQAFDSPVGGLVISYLERQSDQGSFHGHVGILGEVRAARIRRKGIGIMHRRYPIKVKVMSPKTGTKKYPNLDRGLAFDAYSASLEGKER